MSYARVPSGRVPDFKCCSEHAGIPLSDATSLNAASARDAAEQYAERRWAEWDYPDEISVEVWTASGATLCGQYLVQAVQSVSYVATEQEVEEPTK